MNKPPFILLVVAVALITSVLVEFAVTGYTSNKAIKECEKSLPRDQKCIIIAKSLLKQD